MSQAPLFSGAVRLGDLNDYIAPSQSCVVALSGGKLLLNQQPDELQLHERSDRARLAVLPGAPPTVQEAIKVSLHDCLACSGCVTSAETVLLQHQSGDEFLGKLREPGATVVVSVSPQSRAALAAFYGLPPLEAFQRLTAWFHSLGVHCVLDVSGGRDMALLEAAAEFCDRYRSSQQCTTSGRGAEGDDGSQACKTMMDVDAPTPVAASGPLPMLASACPGWVCYAEKTHGLAVLPYMSTTRSPQAVMGALVKRFLCPAWGVDPSRCYHCAVMPCYDKKLEAARDELMLDTLAETDSCLTTSEVQQLLQQAGVSHLRDVPLAPLDALLPAGGGRQHQQDGRLYGLPGGSGGYADFVFRCAARELFGRVLPAGPLPFRTLRNIDMQEVVLEGEDGRPLLRFALAYGFRNIQALMRKVKAGRCEYQYIEVMACPSGCLNGGGQLKPPAGQTPQQLIEHLETLYHQDVIPRHPADSPEVQELYRCWVGGTVYSASARQLLHTTYRQREKTVTSTISDW